jgi:hypothetical protein
MGLAPVAAVGAVREGALDDAAVAALVMALYPHPRLGAAFYDRVAHAYLAGRDAAGRAALADFVTALDEGSAGSWRAASIAERQARIAAQRTNPFMGGLLWTLPELIYRDPQVWALIGFGGSAIEKGGYLHQGFDDIDWLPRA